MTALNWNYKGYGINGEFVAVGDRSFKNINPAKLNDEPVLWGENVQLVNQAIDSAYEAQKKWRSESFETRCKKFLSFVLEIEKRSEDIALAITLSTGKTLKECRGELGAVARKSRLTVEKGMNLVKAVPGREEKVRYQFAPLGVMGIIGPFNFPIHLVHSHVAPGLLLGNSVVIKASEFAPLVSQIYFECAQQSDLPAGLINTVQGGPAVGKALTTHPKVTGVVFTGSYDVGLKIKRDCLEHPFKLLALEMGGKNLCLVDHDADLNLAAQKAAFSVMGAAGQKCSATSRILIHHTKKEQFCELLKSEMLKYQPGNDLLDENTNLGTLVSPKSVETFLSYQEKMAALKPVVLLSGSRFNVESCFVNPGLRVLDFDCPSELLWEEVFAPDVTVQGFDNLDNCYDLLNQNPFGLCLSYFGEKKENFRDFVSNTRAGVYNFNNGTTGASGELPFGGIGRSGNYRPAGILSPFYCSYAKAIQE